MRAITLMYHDVVEPGQFNSSGFQRRSSDSYKLERHEFESHLKAISQASKDKPARIFDLGIRDRERFPLLLTFDDGGVSAYTCIADLLERYGWVGHFLVTTNYIGSPSFLSAGQIRELRKRGHVIGTHSSSHPSRMSSCSWDVLLDEWNTSVRVLSDILGEQVSVASIPGGYYSRKIARAAALAGIKALFTSEPIARCHSVENCLILGRYAVSRTVSSEVIARIVSSELSPRMKQLILWNLKKIGKSLGGELYLKVRKLYFENTTAS